MEGQLPKQDMGLISLIQRFSIHDGPGIRTTVFLKGCPLSCWWCQNPESLNPYPELMARDSKCQMCGNCADSCPIGAITFDRKGGRKIDRAKCNRCFKCTAACPAGSLIKVGNYMTEEEVMAEVEKDEIFYHRSKGGVTISGGEPLFQAAFVTRLLRACKQRGFHTALDTSGYAPWASFEKVLKYVDLVLYDIKHMDSKLHKKMTGHSNELILGNIRKLPVDKRVWLRIPLVTGFNDTKENLEKVGELGKEIAVERVSLLPLHRLGEGKYNQLGRQSPLADVETPNQEQVQLAQRTLEGFGLRVTIGE